MSIEGVVEQIMAFQRRMNDWSPRKSNLRWFGLGRYQAQVSLVFKSTEDMWNHAAAMVGYFDGFEARARFQESCLRAPEERDIFNLCSFIKESLAAVQNFFSSLLERKALSLFPGGPSKPGPKRTLQVCEQHLANLKRTICGLLIAMTKGLFRETLELDYVQCFNQEN